MKLSRQGKREKRRARFLFILKTIPVLALAGAIGAAVILLEREKPTITLLDSTSLMGPESGVRLQIVDEKSGIRMVEVSLVQGEKKARLFVKSFPRAGYFFQAGPGRVDEFVTIKGKDLGFTDGALNLVVSARDFSFWNLLGGNESVQTHSLELDTQPPVVSVMESPRIVKPGGAGLVIYRLGEEAVRHGVSINALFYPGFPLPDRGDGVFASFIGLPYDLKQVDDAHVLADDLAGNQGRANFGLLVKEAIFRKGRRINISDSFLELKLPEFRNYFPEMTGPNVDQYVYVNSKIREKNYEKILEVCKTSSAERLWQGRFLRMSRSSRQAGFGDHRTYFYQGKEIDRQVHLGIDLASTRHAEVEAANYGKVAYAGYLGIYGRTVILDHGQGVFSLYSHLSQITTSLETVVDKGSVIAISGASGMAGGDHLHFSILVNGIFVSPVEWWDAHWLKVNILDLL